MLGKEGSPNCDFFHPHKNRNPDWGLPPAKRTREQKVPNSPHTYDLPNPTVGPQFTWFLGVIHGAILCVVLTMYLLRSRPGMVLWVLPALAVGAILGSVISQFVLSRRRVAVSLGPDTLVLLRADGTTATSMPYRELTTLGIFGNSNLTRRFVLSTVNAALVLALGRKADLQRAESLIEGIRERIRESANGTARLNEIDSLSDVFRKKEAKVPFIVCSFVALCVGAFFIQNAVGFSAEQFARLGANVPFLVWQGEWWRLFSATLLHANRGHLIFNMLAILILGSVLEQTLGSRAVFLILSAAAVAGAATSVIRDDALMSVGTSAVGFGALASLLVLQALGSGKPHAAHRPLELWWTGILLLYLLGPRLPEIDRLANVGGFIGGGLVTLAFLYGYQPMSSFSRSLSIAATGLGVAVWFVAISFAIKNTNFHDRVENDHQLAREIPTTSRYDAEVRNKLAWKIVIDPEASYELLVKAEALAASAVRDRPKDVGIRDTWEKAQARLESSTADGG